MSPWSVLQGPEQFQFPTCSAGARRGGNALSLSAVADALDRRRLEARVPGCCH